MDSVSGIIVIATNDPLTKMLSLITGSEHMTVGFYNSSAINGSSVINLTLYNTWEKTMPKWVEFFYNYDHELTLDKVLSFPMVTSVTMYPIKKELDFRFRLYSTKVTSEENLNHEKIGYSWLFCHSTKFNFPREDYMINTGYDAINSVITSLESNFTKHRGTMDIIVPNQLMSPQIKYDIMKKVTIDNTDVNKFFKEEIDMFISAFLELFNGYPEFQRNLIELKKGNTLINYIRLENNLFDDIKKGIVSDDRIYELNKIRNECNEKLVTKEDYYNDKREEIANELMIMGDFLNGIVETIKNDELVVFQLNTLLSHYNNMCKNIGLKELEYPEFDNANAVIISKESEFVVNDKTISLGCNNFKTYTKEQLKELLKSINEICYFDPKYISLQNKIIEEISTRI